MNTVGSWVFHTYQPQAELRVYVSLLFPKHLLIHEKDTTSHQGAQTSNLGASLSPFLFLCPTCILSANPGAGLPKHIACILSPPHCFRLGTSHFDSPSRLWQLSSSRSLCFCFSKVQHRPLELNPNLSFILTKACGIVPYYLSTIISFHSLP